MQRVGAIVVCIVVSCFGSWVWGIGGGDSELILRRGDANMDVVVDSSDAMYITNWLFSGGPSPLCLNQADVNDDGIVDQSDAVFLMVWLYDGGYAPPAPGPFATSCSSDSAPSPGCDVDPCE